MSRGCKWVCQYACRLKFAHDWLLVLMKFGKFSKFKSNKVYSTSGAMTSVHKFGRRCSLLLGLSGMCGMSGACHTSHTHPHLWASSKKCFVAAMSLTVSATIESQAGMNPSGRMCVCLCRTNRNFSERYSGLQECTIIRTISCVGCTEGKWECVRSKGAATR